MQWASPWTPVPIDWSMLRMHHVQFAARYVWAGVYGATAITNRLIFCQLAKVTDHLSGREDGSLIWCRSSIFNQILKCQLSHFWFRIMQKGQKLAWIFSVWLLWRLTAANLFKLLVDHTDVQRQGLHNDDDKRLYQNTCFLDSLFRCRPKICQAQVQAENFCNDGDRK